MKKENAILTDEEREELELEAEASWREAISLSREIAQDLECDEGATEDMEKVAEAWLEAAKAERKAKASRITT